MIQRILGLFEQYHHQTWSDTQLILTYTDDRSYHLLKVLKAWLLERYQFSAQHLHIVQMNPVIWAHVWPGTIGLFSWKR
jgi:fatty acid-binding protein DegV